MDIKNKAKSVASRVKNTVTNPKFVVALGAVAIGAIALQQSNRTAFYRFLEEKGIDPEEFYCPEFYAEKQELNS